VKTSLFATVVLVLATAAPSRAQGVALTVDEAVKRAVEHNPDLAIVKLETEVEAAHVAESRTAYTPVLSTTLGRSNSTTPPTNFLLGTQGIDTGDWFRRPAFASACLSATGRGACRGTPPGRPATVR
jgi:outer membrane protein TolC